MSLATADQLSLPRDPAAAMEAATKQYVDAGDAGAMANAPSPDYISGLKLSYIDARHVQVNTGAWADPTTGQLLRLTAALPFAITLNSGHAHVFLTQSGGSITAIGVALTLGAPYFGTAINHSVYGRYIGSVLSLGSAIVPFTHFNNRIRYLTNPSAAPFRVLSSGSATTSTSVNLSGVLPLTARIAHARLLEGGGAQAYINTPDMGAVSSSNYITTARPGSELEADVLTDASQKINYVLNGASSLNIDVQGYDFER